MPIPIIPLEDAATTGTNAVNAKAALFNRLELEPALAGITIGYCYSGKVADTAREYIYLGSTDITQDRRATGYVRDETAVLDVVILVRVPGGQPYDADLRAQQLGAALENLIGRNPNLDNTVGQLVDYTVTAGTLDNTIDDDAAVTQLVYKVAVTSYLQ